MTLWTSGHATHSWHCRTHTVTPLSVLGTIQLWGANVDDKHWGWVIYQTIKIDSCYWRLMSAAVNRCRTKLTWFTLHLDDGNEMACETEWGDGVFYLNPKVYRKSLSSRQTVQIHDVHLEWMTRIRKTNMRQIMRGKKDMKDDLAGTSIIYTLFLNCLYLLFICCSRQLCSGEMVTNARDRLATTGQLTQPSVSGLLSLLPLWRLPLFPLRLFHPAQWVVLCH